MKGVTDMFSMCYAMLNDEQLEQVDDLAEMRPRPPDVFYRLRDRLVFTHTLDAYQRLKQLLALPPLGGQKPSALLAQMRQLCPPGKENTMFFCASFLQRLPPAIRLQLAEDRHSPVQPLAARGDALIVHHSYSTAAAVQAFSVPAAGPSEAVAAVGKQEWWHKGRRRARAACRWPKEN